MVHRQVIAFLTGFCIAVAPSTGSASPGFGSNLEMRASVSVQKRSGPFQAPAKLRGRVDFWKDVFAKYGRSHAIVHHREFPQIVFGVMDFTEELRAMTPAQFKRHRSSVEKDTFTGIRRQIEPLARGKGPETPFQHKIVKLMEFLPKGTAKYRRLLEEDELIRTQTGIRERYADAVRRSWRYLPVMEQIFVSEYGMPKELTRLPFIESSFDYTAYSSVGAAGIWQFMPRTAKAHGMMVGRIVDERRDPIRATRGAAEYLRSAYKSLGAWPLAVTSYNHGVGGVRGKINKAGTTDLVDIIEHPSERYFGFASTNFWPEFLAANEIFDDHTRYFPELELASPLRVVTYKVRGATSAGYIARQLGVPMEELKEANYALLDPVWQGRNRIPAGYNLRVPVQYQDRLSRLGTESGTTVTAASNSTIYGGVTYKVRRGDTLSSIAKRYNTNVKTLMALNDKSKPTARLGETLTVREKGSGAVAIQPISAKDSTSLRRPGSAAPKVASKSSSKAKKSTTTRYRVKRGDTLSSISKRTGRSVNAIKRANGMKGTALVAGKTIVIP